VAAAAATRLAVLFLGGGYFISPRVASRAATVDSAIERAERCRGQHAVHTTLVWSCNNAEVRFPSNCAAAV
jgi:hypothetical protein